MGKVAATGHLSVRPLTAARLDDFATVLRGTSWGGGCWDLHPRFTAKQQLALAGAGSNERRRAALGRLAGRRRAPGLLGYRDGKVSGWISIGPRFDYSRLATSRATPPVDDVKVWVIPCMAVRPEARGQGVTVALIEAAVAYAAKRGAPAVEAYPRADGKRVHDDRAFIGTTAMFRRAGFRRVRGVLDGLPRNWTRRVTMRIACGTSKTSSRPRAPSPTARSRVKRS